MAPKILITDDNAFMRVTLRNLLEENGYEVVGEAKDGQQAVQLYQELQPDLIFMDITMPGTGGIAAVKEIIRLDSQARIIMVSAMGQKAFVMDALKAGAKDFVVKPFQPNRILGAVARVVNKNQGRPQ